MKSHSFTSDDAAQNKDKDLQYIAESFDPKHEKIIKMILDLVKNS